MKKILMLKGLPGSKKTEKAKEIINKDPSYVRLNRRDLSQVLFSGTKINPEQKRLIATIEYKLAEMCISLGKNVIIDDSNLHPKIAEAYLSLANKVGVALEIMDDRVPIDLCLKNNSKKKELDRVPSEDIVRLAKKYDRIRSHHFRNSEYVIYFLEDVLADISYRRAIFKNETGLCGDHLRDNLAIANDKIIRKYLDKLEQDLHLGYEIVIITLRPDYCRSATERWLKGLGIPYNELVCKPDASINDDIFRLEAVVDRKDLELCKKIVDTQFAVESVWKNYGITTEYSATEKN